MRFWSLFYNGVWQTLSGLRKYLSIYVLQSLSQVSNSAIAIKKAVKAHAVCTCERQMDGWMGAGQDSLSVLAQEKVT